MTAFAAALRRLTRGPAVEGLLRRFDIQPRQYWLLTDLFRELTERREMFGHLGRDGVSLRTTATVYAVITGIISLIEVLIGVTPLTYLITFLALTGFLLFTILLSETSNSLVNPVEAAVLAQRFPPGDAVASTSTSALPTRSRRLRHRLRSTPTARRRGSRSRFMPPPCGSIPCRDSRRPGSTSRRRQWAIPPRIDR